MSEWKEYKLGEHVFINSRSVDKNYQYKEIEYLDTGSITRGKIESLQRFRLEDAPSRAKRIVKDNDIVLSMVRPIQRHYGYLRNLQPNTVVSTGFVVLTNKESIDPYFLYSFLTQDDTTEYLDAVAEGSTSAYPAFTPDVVENLSIFLPPLPEQRAIARVLSSIDDKIDLLYRQNKTLEGIAEALWRKMFVEEAEAGWKKGKLGDVAEETIGGDWGEDIQSNDLIPVICLRGVDLQNIKESGFSSEAPIRFIRPTSLEKRKLNENEILIAGSGIGPIGKSIPVNSALLKCYSYPVIYSNFCKRLRAASKEMAYFIEFMIYRFYKEGELDQFHMGTSVPNFNLKDFLNYEVTIPPADIVALFSSFLTEWYNIKFANQIRTISRLRDTLLPKLMSGEVRVKL